MALSGTTGRPAAPGPLASRGRTRAMSWGRAPLHERSDDTPALVSAAEGHSRARYLSRPPRRRGADRPSEEQGSDVSRWRVGPLDVGPVTCSLVCPDGGAFCPCTPSHAGRRPGRGAAGAQSGESLGTFERGKAGGTTGSPRGAAAVTALPGGCRVQSAGGAVSVAHVLLS